MKKSGKPQLRRARAGNDGPVELAAHRALQPVAKPREAARLRLATRDRELERLREPNDAGDVLGT